MSKETKKFEVTCTLTGVGEVNFHATTDYYPEAIEKINAGETPQSVAAWVQDTYGIDEMAVCSYDTADTTINGSQAPGELLELLEHIHPEFGEKIIEPLLRNVGVNDAGLATMREEE